MIKMQRVQLKAKYSNHTNEVVISYKGLKVMHVRPSDKYKGMDAEKVAKLVLEENRKLARDIVLDHVNG
jgi:hypothetical protein